MSPAAGGITKMLGVVKAPSSPRSAFLEYYFFFFFLLNLQHSFKTNSKVRCQLFLGVVREIGEMEEERGRAQGQGGALISWGGWGGKWQEGLAVRSRQTKGHLGRKKGKDEHGGTVILKCSDSSGVFAPEIALP